MPDFSSGETLAVVGDLLQDIVVWHPAAVRPATDNPSVIHRRRGGSAANVATFAAGLVPTRFIGRIGDDALGRELAEELAAEGVDVRVQRAGRTGTIVVLVDPAGERTMFPDRAAAGELTPVPAQWLQDAGCVHVTAYAFATQRGERTTRALLAAAGEAGRAISVDASSTDVLHTYGPRSFLELMAHVRPAFLFANAAEADLLGLHRHTPAPDTTLVLKAGGEPTTLVTDSERFTVPVESIAAPRDSTGAGDAFAAGFLAAAMSGQPLADAAKAGHGRAAQVLAAPGASLPRTDP